MYNMNITEKGFMNDIIDINKYGYVYRITNNINNKTYVGQHKIVKDEKWMSYMGSGRLICHAIKKYGKDNFSKILLCYADSSESLNKMEKFYIQKELSQGHAEYNIIGSDSNLAFKLAEIKVKDEDLLSWYFDDNMSYPDIAFILNCSVPTIFNYMQKFRNLDNRFNNIKQGNSRGKSFFSEDAFQKGQENAHKKISCPNCDMKVSHANYSKHVTSCTANAKAQFKKHKCAKGDCPKMVYVKNKFCKDHYQDNHKKACADNNKNFGDSVKRGGLVASHNRWHMKRGVVSDKCELCQESICKI